MIGCNHPAQKIFLFFLDGYITPNFLLMNGNNIFSDPELIQMLRNGSDTEQTEAFEIIYLNHKKYCTSFMRSKFGEREEIKDIYQNAMIVFRENINKPGWGLKCSIQTYLNSICFHQGLTAFGKSRITLEPGDDVEEISDWCIPMEETLNTERVKVIVNILNDKKKTTEICYEILTRRLYRNQSYEIISQEMDYNNARTVITRNYKCLQSLKKEVFNVLSGK